MQKVGDGTQLEEVGFRSLVLEESFLSSFSVPPVCNDMSRHMLLSSLSLSSKSRESRTMNENLGNYKSKQKFLLNYFLHEVIIHCDTGIITTYLYKMQVRAPVCKHLSWNICDIIVIKTHLSAQKKLKKRFFFSGWKYTRTKCGRECLGGWKHVAHHFDNILPQITYNETQATLKVLEVFAFFCILSSSQTSNIC